MIPNLWHALFGGVGIGPPWVPPPPYLSVQPKPEKSNVPHKIDWTVRFTVPKDGYHDEISGSLNGNTKSLYLSQYQGPYGGLQTSATISMTEAQSVQLMKEIEKAFRFTFPLKEEF
jgi:hypothetical protein